jgi:hypothetical protein
MRGFWCVLLLLQQSIIVTVWSGNHNCGGGNGGMGGKAMWHPSNDLELGTYRTLTNQFPGSTQGTVTSEMKEGKDNETPGLLKLFY